MPRQAIISLKSLTSELIVVACSLHIFTGSRSLDYMTDICHVVTEQCVDVLFLIFYK